MWWMKVDYECDWKWMNEFALKWMSYGFKWENLVESNFLITWTWKI